MVTSEDRPVTALPDPGYPDAKCESIFADGVTGVAPGKNVVKIQYSRTDANFQVSHGGRTVVVSQIIMPMENFIQSAQFFQNIIDNLVSKGALDESDVKQIRDTAGGK